MNIRISYLQGGVRSTHGAVLPVNARYCKYGMRNVQNAEGVSSILGADPKPDDQLLTKIWQKQSLPWTSPEQIHSDSPTPDCRLRESTRRKGSGNKFESIICNVRLGTRHVSLYTDRRRIQSRFRSSVNSTLTSRRDQTYVEVRMAWYAAR